MTEQKPNSLCPLCAQPNQCAIAAGQAAANCWCMTTTISEEAKEKANDANRCICPACGREPAA
ncbi:cysteine-rich CWC family protein [Spongiibacter sp. IMCC21906]|uniref:cysteine-rich CWC family protein n=1 Tax=Spongiibacter sp. IMCC21906 TaxID=1620392 RepID=UPI00062E8669|nr:cysteine-rich CWC family protein [Spongiibacter sp. IMCC21906]